MGLTFDEAFELTNPSLNEDQRKSSALALMAGTAANDVYWNHTDTITALKAQAAGHGAPPPAPDEHPEADADATAVEEGTDAGAAQVGTGAASEPATPEAPAPTAEAPAPAQDPNTAEVTRLRRLLAQHGVDPTEGA